MRKHACVMVLIIKIIIIIIMYDKFLYILQNINLENHTDYKMWLNDYTKTVLYNSEWLWNTREQIKLFK